MSDVGEPTSKLDVKTIVILALAIIFSMVAGAGLMRVVLRPPGPVEAGLKPGSIDVAFSPKPQLATAQPLAGAPEETPPASAARLPMLPLPPKLPTRAPEPAAPAAESAAEAPEEIAPANFFNYGLEDQPSRSTAQENAPNEPPARQKLKRMRSIGQVRTHRGMARRGFSTQAGASGPAAAAPARPNGGEALKTYLSRTFGMPDGSMTVPLSSFGTTPTAALAATGDDRPGRGGSTTGAIDPRLRRPGDPTLTEEAAQSAAIEPRHATIDMAAGNALNFRVTDIPKERTVVCFEVLAHPCVPDAAGPGNLCDDPGNYASFNGNSEWRYQGDAWVGTFAYNPAIWACEGIRVRFVFADKKTGAHAGAGIDVDDSRH